MVESQREKTGMNERWLIELLGELRVVRGARSVTRLSSRKTEALLAYLALQPGRAFPREVLADQFWPEASPESARHSLRMALSSLRKLFGEGLATDNQTVRLHQEAIHTDVSAFEAAVHAGRWGDAVGLYRGALLPALYDDWVVQQQTRLAELFGFAACHWIAEATERTIALDRAIRAVALAPHHPDLLAALERLQPQVESHVGEKRASRPPEPPNPTVATMAPRGAPDKPALPLKLTRFIGRASELMCLQDWLVPGSGTRLMTLTGPGGSGKTRLAIELAQRTTVTAPSPTRDTVWFLSLSDLSPATPLTDALRRTLGLADTTETDPLETIAGVLREPPTALLILDNAEQQIDAVGALTTALLTRAPGLRCLVTSRRRLDIEGERELPLRPLGQDEAVELFENRAQAARADFSLTDTNRASVAALCQRLDGLPLALEIAAARITVLSPAQLLARIGERLDFYSRQQREVRHRSLRAAIQTSYELLSEPLQRIFTRLVVFSSGWTLEDAQSVLGESDLFEELEALRAHSLLYYVSAPDAPVVRFGMLETLSSFAREQLDPLEAEGLAQRHAAHFFDLGVAAGPAVSRITPEWRARCFAAYENLQSALDWLRRHDPERAATLILEVAPYWFGINFLAEGQRQLEACLAAKPTLPNPLKGALRQTLGYFAEELGDLPRARALLEESVSLLRPYPEDIFLGWALHNLGTTLIRCADYDGAVKNATVARDFWQAKGDATGIAAALTSLAQIARHRGQIRQAATLAEDALRDRTGWWRANIMTVLGSIRYRQGRAQEARLLLTQSAQLHESYGSTTRLAQTLRYRALAALMDDDIRSAEVDCDQAEQIYQRIGVSRGVALTEMIRAEIALYQEEGQKAQAFLKRAEPPHTVADDADYLLLAGRIALLNGDTGAHQTLHQALRLFSESGLLLGQLEAFEALAEALPEYTGSWLAAASQQRESLGAPVPRIENRRRQEYRLIAQTIIPLEWPQALSQALDVGTGTGRSVHFSPGVSAPLRHP